MEIKMKNIRNAVNSRNPYSYFTIYRYGTCLEITAMILGVILGLLSAGGIAYNLEQVGELTTSFVERTGYPDRMSSYLPLLQLFGGGRRLVNATFEENMEALLEDAQALAIGMGVTMSICILLSVASVTLIGWSALKQVTKIRMAFLRAVLRQDMIWYDTDDDFNLASKMSEDLMKIKEGMSEKLGLISNLVGTALLCLGTAFSLGWKLALATSSILPFSMACSIIMSNYQTKANIIEMKSYSQAGKQAEEVLKSVKTVVAFAGENKEAERYKELLQPAEKHGRRRGIYSGIGNGFNWVLTYSLNFIGICYGTRLVLNDFFKPEDERNYVFGVIFSVITCAYMASQSVTMCVPQAEIFSGAKAAAASIFEIIDSEPKIDALDESGLLPRRVRGEIILENVHFCYPSRPDTKVLNGLSLHINSGECVALVGASGCGKSTIIQLLQRLYDPLSGSVKLDGKDLKSFNLSWMRSSLGVVGQEPVLFRGSIHDNIAIGFPEATREDVQRVAEMAYAHDFISNLPKGYDTLIGERGASLSGGQKQRVAIARSLLRDPAVLLLDEATSALDPHSERQVQAALDRASLGRTTIMVSHRLSTIVNANRIICMDQGGIVEQGTHAELMKSRGSYYKLVTKDNETNEPEEIEPVMEETDEEVDEEQPQPARAEVRRPSIRRIPLHTPRRGSNGWITPRGSIEPVVTGAVEHYLHNTLYGSDAKGNEDDEHVKPLNDRELMRLNAQEWVELTIGSIAAMIQGACFPAFAVLFGYISEIFVLADHEEVLHLADTYSFMFLAVAVIAGVSMCIQSVTFTSAGLKMTTRLRSQYFSALLFQEMGFYDKESNTVGAICARLSGDAAAIQSATGLRIGLIIQGLSSVSFGIILGLCYNWKLTLVVAVLLPIMIGSIWLDGLVTHKSQAKERAALEDATAVATEAIVSIKTVQSLGIERLFLDKFHVTLLEANKAIATNARIRGLVLGLGIYLPFLSFCTAIVYGTILVTRNEIDYKTVLLVTEGVMYGAYMLGQSLVASPGFNSAKACGARILATIDREPKVRTGDRINEKEEWVATGKFHLKDVEFAYPTRRHQRVLRGIDLQVEAGKTVALVGASGCGKSTILQLLQRFYDPDTGNIELDTHNIRTALSLPRLRRQLGVVQQEPVLFDRTLAENIAYGDNYRKVSMAEIVAAAKAANIHSFIVSLPKGYETNLGASGAQLSGGQKQRVCIARALVRSPRLLLLDEATSALDANSERVVAEALDKAAQGRTCITIAHRLSTIKDADLICVLHKGKIVEKGKHAELLSKRGFYWKLSRGQQFS